MIHKQVLPESFDFGVPSVQMIGVGSKGLDKTAMVKRASAFDDVLQKLEKKANRTYLHVITTGAFQKYGANRNCFIAGTKVTTNKGAKNIQDISTKDVVLSDDGKLHAVANTMTRQYEGRLVTITVDGIAQPVTMTADHPVKILRKQQYQDLKDVGLTHIQLTAFLESLRVAKGGFCEASTICAGDFVFLAGLFSYQRGAVIASVTRIDQSDTEQSVPVYNMEVQDSHTFCVPFVVHNCDAWNGESFDMDIPQPQDGKTTSIKLDGGLSKYHDDTYMRDGAVYQQHQTKRAGVDPSGQIVCARYNPMMKRGQLLIAVDTNKWAPRLQKKAQGKDIYLSIGADVPHDLCHPAGTLVLTNFGYKAIQTIQIGDIVRTAAGTWKHVVATSKRYSNSMTRMNTMGFPLQLECTPNHPYAVVRQSQLESCTGSRQNLKCMSKTENLSQQWLLASQIAKGDYLKIRIDTCAALDTVGQRLAYQQGAKASSEHINDELLGWSARQKSAFVAGWLDASGDVTQDGNTVKVCSENREMALVLQRLLWSLGIEAATHLDNPCAPTAQCSYYVLFYRATEDLCRLSMKLARHTDLVGRKQNGSTVLLDGGYAYVRVTDARTFQCAPVMVYNMQVQDDHTYNAQGADVHNCMLCGRKAKTASQHCDHFTKHRGQVFDCGKVACVMNDSPNFYDISGVDVPADRIAFVLQKVASGDTTAKQASSQAFDTLSSRPPMLLTKAAYILNKLSRMQKEIQGLVQGDKVDTQAYEDDEDAKKDFILEVENYPSDQVIDGCNRKGILLSPSMLFKILAGDCQNQEDRKALEECDDDSCGDLSCMMEQLAQDEDANQQLRDGSFDQRMPVDLNLDDILQKFLPQFGTSNPVIQSKVIRITITGRPRKQKSAQKKASFNKFAEEALRRTYSRYLISFAAQNDDASCRNALMKIAVYGK